MMVLQINSQHHSLKAKGFHHVHTDILTQKIDILTTPQTITNLDGNDYVLPPILEQIGDLKVKQMDHSGGGASTTGGSAPLSFAALDWETSLINAIEYAYGHNMFMKTVGEAVGYAICNYPQESVVEWFEKQLDHLTQQAWTIIYPAKFEVIGACPQCGTHTVKIGDVITTALQVHEVFARCGYCQTMWWGTEIIDLASHFGALKNTPTAID